MLGSRLIGLLGLSALGLILASLATFIFTFRFSLNYGDAFPTTCTEEMSIYAIWKVVHGYPVYEWPNKDWYTLSLYNWLFYYLYGIVGRVAHADAMRLALVGRTLTLLFSVAGALLSGLVARCLVVTMGLRPNLLVLVAGAFLVWFAPGGPISNIYTVRPDNAALAVSLAALAFFIRGLPSSPGLFVLSGLLFYLAWSIKQSMVCGFLGCLAYLLVVNEWRSLLVLAVPFFIPVAATVLLGGEVYRYNVFYAPAISPFGLSSGFIAVARLLFDTMYVGGFILYFPCLMLAAGLWPISFQKLRHFSLASRQLLLLLLVVGVSAVLNAIVLAKEGSSNNAAFEFLASTGIIGIVCLHHLLQREVPWKNAWLAYVSIFLAASALFFTRNLSQVRQGHLGIVGLISQADYDSRIKYAEWVKTLPPPLLVRDAIFALPWNSNRDGYPAILTDVLWYPEAQSRGILAGRGIQALVAKKYFASILVAPGDELLPDIRNAKYVEAPIPPDKSYYQNVMFPRKEGPLMLFVRRDDSEAK